MTVDVPLAPGATETEAGEPDIVNAGAVTVSETVAVCVIPPPVPVTTTGYVPAAVVDPTVSVRVEDPEPGAAMDVAPNAAVVPVGSPDALSAMAELKPPEMAVAMVLVPLAPWATDTDTGDALIVNAGAVTVSETVAVWVTPPPVPVTVRVYEPAAAVEATAMVIVEVPEPGEATDDGLKLTVTPVGCPVAVRAIAELKPPETAVVMVDVPLFPGATETVAGEPDIVKLADVETPASAASRPAFGLPQPVTRS